jgi:Na+/H+-dicarboxylate symporter
MIARLYHFKMPLLLFLTLIVALTMGHLMPLSLKSFFYTLSLTIKDGLIFILPFLIFSFLFSSMGHLHKGALRFTILLLPCVMLSNMLSTFLAFGVGQSFLSSDMLTAVMPQTESSLTPLWAFSLPKLISNDSALTAGFVLGIIGTFAFRPTQEKIARSLLHLCFFILRKVFVPLMPLFILGFSLKLEHEGTLIVISRDYPKVFVLIGCAAFGYITLLYGLLSAFHLKRWFFSIRHMVSAMIAGFSTMSSAASMPLTIEGAEKNIRNPDLARSVIPATVNIHLIGDCFAIPIFALAILVSFHGGLPSLEQYALFTFYFILAKFAVAAVPGGGVLVMLPVLEKYLGFSAPMLSLITALYVIFDPLITAANIMGNGAFAMGFSKLYAKTEKLSNAFFSKSTS